MDVILLEDVKTLGKKGQIVKINDGYARNYVLPKKLGIEATAKNLNDLKLARKREEKEAAEELAAAKELAAKIKECTVTVSMKTGEGGRTFGTVSTKEVAEEAKKQLGLDIDKKKMKLKDSGLPQLVIDQTPKRFRGQKVPIVKAKIGNQIMSLMCDEKIFEQIPVKKSVKAKVSGIYILEVKGLRTNLETPTGKRSFRSRMQDKLTGMQAKAKAAAEKTDKK